MSSVFFAFIHKENLHHHQAHPVQLPLSSKQTHGFICHRFLKIYIVYIRYIIYLCRVELNQIDMETTIKRKNIDLPVDVLQKLSIMAVAQGRSLKAYIEQLLIAKANSITIEVRENPSPSGDKWFDDPENMESVRRGIQEMNEGQGKAYTTDEIRERLGL